MPIKEIVTAGMSSNINDPKRKGSWSVGDEKEGGLVIYDNSSETLDEARKRAGAGCAIAVNIATLSRLIVSSRLKKQIGDEAVREIEEAIKQGGFLILNASFMSLCSWLSTPNRERGH